MLQLLHNLLHSILTYPVALLLLIICKFIYNIYLHPLSCYPGPKTWTATRLTWTCAVQFGDYHRRLHELHKQYGTVVRVAPDELSYISPEAWKDIYENRAIQKNRVWAGQEEESHPISIVSTDEPTHLRNRRALAGAFTDHAIREHSSILEDYVGLMMAKFKEEVQAKNGHAIINVVDWMNWLTFDISGALSFGESFDSVRNGHAHPWVDISCNFGKGIALIASINFFRPLNRILKMTVPKSIRMKMEYHKQISHEKFEQRLEMQERAKAQDYVGSIMAYNQEKGEVKISNEEIEVNMTLLIFAGSETTSTALSSIINQLLQSPLALQKAQAEIRSAFQKEEDINVASVTHLQYLSAVIQEGIRLGPPAAIGIPRITPNEGAIIAGKFVPSATFVTVNQYPAFRSASNFTDPNAFIPERFLDSTPYPGDRIDAYEPFLVGRHKCIGQKLAWSIMRLTIARFLYAFDVRRVEGPSDFGDQKTYIFWEKLPVKVEIRPRL